MSDHTDEQDDELEPEVEESSRGWSTGSFLAGIVIGAAVGAGVALLLAPESGERTRRAIRKRVRGLREDAADGYLSARKEVRQMLKDKKAALREKVKDLAESLD
ncbi:MAG TPA: YtxH domain-containing protein [Gemmatimonadales bacterium]|nr:YtxH domain-containing protein [Gemmatimonadales bacterium]